jgi:hypothetical protein
MGILSEVKTTYKNPIQGDAENLGRFTKSVWPSKNNPDIVYKFTTDEEGLLELKEEKYLSETYPDLFCKTYGEIKKIKNPKYTLENSNGEEYFYYLAYERLDTRRFTKKSIGKKRSSGNNAANYGPSLYPYSSHTLFNEVQYL